MTIVAHLFALSPIRSLKAHRADRSPIHENTLAERAMAGFLNASPSGAQVTMTCLSRITLPIMLALVLIFPRLCQAETSRIGCQHIITQQGLELGIWYPSTGVATHQDLGPYAQDCVANGPVVHSHGGLVVISHGTGGSWTSHLDTAAALAQAGYIVVSLTEPGDNWRDMSHATDITGRTRALSAALDYMLDTWPQADRIDRHRIGAFGFSAGGLTVLLAAGAQPDLSRIGPWCTQHPKSFTCALIAKAHASIPSGSAPVKDSRIAALSLAAPALGFTMTRSALQDVTLPVQIWQAGDDRILPSPGSVEPVRDNLPTPPQGFMVAHADHFDFLAPCRPEASMAAICTSHNGFDRTAFHTGFNTALVAFFDRTLSRQGASGR